MRALLSIRIVCMALLLPLWLAEAAVATGQEANSLKAQVSHKPHAQAAPALQQRNPRYQLRKGDNFDVDFVRARLTKEKEPNASEERIVAERQAYFYAFSVLGFGGLSLLAPRQATAILPLLLAFSVGVPFRLAPLRRSRGSTDHGVPADVWRRARTAGRRYDVALVALSQLAIGGVLWAKLHPALVNDQRDTAARSEPVRGVPPGKPPASPPKDPPIRFFLLGDTHFHELAGQRTGVHLDLADAIVHVAVRPVELDLLSGFTLARFTQARAELARAAPLPWAHLGDYGDLGCISELDRFGGYVALFGDPPVALVPGNHDSAFEGNFGWHASWDSACAPSPRSTKTVSDAILQLLSPSSETVRHISSRTALTAVRPIGRIGGVDVVGAFVDTSDSSSIAVAGIQGAISTTQESFVRAELAKWKDPWVVVFMHHPYDELTWDSQQALGRMLSDVRARTLALVSAHTHLAALRAVDLGGAGSTPELVIGAMIDPPQESALLEIGESEPGNVALRVVTIPAVARSGATCGEGVTPTVPAATCRAVFDRAKAACTEITGATSRPVEGSHPQSPALVKAAQQIRAQALFACLDRLQILKTHFGAAPLDDPTLFTTIDAAAKALVAEPADAAKQQTLDELTCFAWAGAALQQHKFEPNWSYAHALDVALDPGTVFAATEMTYDRKTGAGTQRACASPSPLQK